MKRASEFRRVGNSLIKPNYFLDEAINLPASRQWPHDSSIPSTWIMLLDVLTVTAPPRDAQLDSCIEFYISLK